MTPVYCQECKRANSETASKCIWCGLPLRGPGQVTRIGITKVEIGYLDGINRFEDSMPVRLIIGDDGIEVAELIPGTRSMKIPASAVLGANVVDASTTKEGTRVRSTWLWLTLGPFALLFPGKRTPDQKIHDYILTVRYRDGAETRTAVFHREDRAGLSVVEGLARIVQTLASQK